MKKPVHFFNQQQRVFMPLVFLLILCAAIGSSFTELNDPPAKSQSACNGPFYTTNILGPNFSVGLPGTGAPDNNGNCGRAGGCHASFADNSGIGVLTIKVDTGITEYLPGKTYPVKVTLTQAGISAMNFQLTTRDESVSSTASGTFILTDPVRTKLTNGNFGGAGTDYIEGTSCGIDVINTGYNEWTFDWQAPLNATGDITFYVGSVAANFNNQSSGDYTYSKKLSLTKFEEVSTVGIQSLELQKSAPLVYPNPATDHINIDFVIKSEGVVSIKLIDLQGKECGILFNKNLTSGNYHQVFQINKEKYPAGVYLVRVLSSEQVINSGLIQIQN